MIVTKARDHSLVQLTRDLAQWLMTSPRHGKPYGVKVYVDSKLEKSNRFDADGLYKDNEIIREKNLLKFWTPESCNFADTFDIVVTVHLFSLLINCSLVVTGQFCTRRGFFNGLYPLLFHSISARSDF